MRRFHAPSMALACGLPVAALPVPGPLDVIGDSGVGVLSQDLREAALAALAIPRERCRAYAAGFTWRHSVEQFLGHPAAVRAGAPHWSRRSSGMDLEERGGLRG